MIIEIYSDVNLIVSWVGRLSNYVAVINLAHMCPGADGLVSKESDGMLKGFILIAAGERLYQFIWQQYAHYSIPIPKCNTYSVSFV